MVSPEEVQAQEGVIHAADREPGQRYGSYLPWQMWDLAGGSSYQHLFVDLPEGSN